MSTASTEPLYLLVHLTITPGEERTFRAYERRALAILRQHGGNLLYALRPGSEPDGPVREIHLLHLPSRQALDSYRYDPALAELRELRAAAVAETSIIYAADISALYAPSPVTIRRAVAADAAAIAHVHIASWRSTYRGIVPGTFLDQLDTEAQKGVHERRIADAANPTVTLVAEVEGKGIVGFAHCGPGRREPPNVAEIYAIYLLESWEGKGIGRRLVSAFIPHLLAAGMERLVVWVLAENRARGFYERLGGREAREETIDLGGATLAVIGYEWDDIRTLTA